MALYKLKTASSSTIDGYAINSSTIGVTTPAEGHFTTLRNVKYDIEIKTSDYTITTADYGKLILMNSGSETTFTFQAVDSADAGSHIFLGKIGSGRVNIAPDFATGDTIMDSTSGSGVLYNDTGVSSCVELTYVDTYQNWLLLFGSGTWITT